MTHFRDTLSALLPAPRDDEPASLRQDIVDELGDHLACAYNCELLRGTDSALARQRAFHQFGNPAAIARRLWLDAMKGKIMAQRILILTCLVVMLACGAAMGLAWQWINQDRLQRSRATAEAIEANRRIAEVLAQSQAANHELLKQMREMSAAMLHPVSPEWNPVTFKLTEQSPGGPPAAGFALALTRLEGNPAAIGVGDTGALGRGRGGMGGIGGGMGGIGGGMGGMAGGIGTTAAGMAKAIHRTSDASGIVDFGAVQPGDYAFRITKRWTNGVFNTVGQLNVAPGSKTEKSIVCPKTPPERAVVRVHWSWPADLEKEQLVIVAPFAFRYRKLDTGLDWVLYDTPGSSRSRRRWSTGMWMNDAGIAVRSVLCGPGATVAEMPDRNALFFWTFSRVNLAGETVKLTAPGGWADILSDNLRQVQAPTESPEAHELTWERGFYGLDRLIVLRASAAQKVGSGQRRFEVILGSFVYGAGPSLQVRGEPPNKFVRVGGGLVDRGGPPTKAELVAHNSASTRPPGSPIDGGMGGPNNGWEAWDSAARTVELSTDFWDKVDVGFEVRLGRVNEWTITVPGELIAAVRAAIKVDQDTKQEAAGPAGAPNGN
jgi:hypothetical protein